MNQPFGFFHCSGLKYTLHVTKQNICLSLYRTTTQSIIYPDCISVLHRYYNVVTLFVSTKNLCVEYICVKQLLQCNYSSSTIQICVLVTFLCYRVLSLDYIVAELHRYIIQELHHCKCLNLSFRILFPLWQNHSGDLKLFNMYIKPITRSNCLKQDYEIPIV